MIAGGSDSLVPKAAREHRRCEHFRTDRGGTQNDNVETHAAPRESGDIGYSKDQCITQAFGAFESSPWYVLHPHVFRPAVARSGTRTGIDPAQQSVPNPASKCCAQIQQEQSLGTELGS